MRHFVLRVPLFALGIVVMNAPMVSSSALAQASKAEVSGGYQVLQTRERTFPAGWYVDGAADLNAWSGVLGTSSAGVVGEIGGAYKNEREQTQTEDVKHKRHTLMGGVRLNWRINPRVVLFHNVLIGFERASRTGTAAVPVSLSETKFALQPNLGVNLMVTNTVGVRAAADFRHVFLGGDRGGVNEYRFTTGVVFVL